MEGGGETIFRVEPEETTGRTPLGTKEARGGFLFFSLKTIYMDWIRTPRARSSGPQQEVRGGIDLSWYADRVVQRIWGVDRRIAGELARCAIEPDLMMFDVQGIAHPRGIGVDSHTGILLEKPSIGVAKSRLNGRHEPVGPARGDRAALQDHHGNVIGSGLRTTDKTNPLYISPGHLIDVEHAVEFVMACCTGYRLPEPTRWAYKVAGGEKLPVEDNNQPRLF